MHGEKESHPNEDFHDNVFSFSYHLNARSQLLKLLANLNFSFHSKDFFSLDVFSDDILRHLMVGRAQEMCCKT
jgi:hypothetical protein